ncbi:hypothetical protein G7Z17_g6273 [Cylindrodendrum hubeiense]|uniref:Uncharacterized protein n=1 Tax=Cylindrodendrum hubeiense TaxID=595255 RepID=A0A9P5LFD9_9HYPO|nr:hypothetical protein G7Z17_g6273 [Cylindrodendrum hubeiense]
MVKRSSNANPKSTGSKRLQTATSPPTANLAEESDTFPSARENMEHADANPDVLFRVQSPMMALFLSDSEAPFTGLARTAPWEQNPVLQAGRRTMTVQAMHGSASEPDDEGDTNKGTDKKERKERKSRGNKEHGKKQSSKT